jgi:hypothetical protein
LTLEYLKLEFTPYGWMEGAQSQYCYGNREPAIPNDDVESRLQGEQQFAANTCIAMTIRLKSKTDTQREGGHKTSCEGPQAGPGGYPFDFDHGENPFMLS